MLALRAPPRLGASPELRGRHSLRDHLRLSEADLLDTVQVGPLALTLLLVSGGYQRQVHPTLTLMSFLSIAARKPKSILSKLPCFG